MGCTDRPDWEQIVKDLKEKRWNQYNEYWTTKMLGEVRKASDIFGKDMYKAVVYNPEHSRIVIEECVPFDTAKERIEQYWK